MTSIFIFHHLAMWWLDDGPSTSLIECITLRDQRNPIRNAIFLTSQLQTTLSVYGHVAIIIGIILDKNLLKNNAVTGQFKVSKLLKTVDSFFILMNITSIPLNKKIAISKNSSPLCIEFIKAIFFSQVRFTTYYLGTIVLV